MQNEKIEIDTYDSYIGKLSIFHTKNLVIQLKFNSNEPYSEKITDEIYNIRTQINEYLLGKRMKFDIDYIITGSAFEKQILQYIATIPYGKTISYKNVAINCGYPKAYRAVGTVLRKNKLPLIIPCHRVIKSDGSIGEYNGGKSIKSKLISLEKNGNISWQIKYRKL